MTVVILAEKPSQGRAYADAFKMSNKKDGYIKVNDNRFFNGDTYITWGFGHLVELVQPEQYKEEWQEWSLETLPILPKQFKFQIAKDKRKQFNVVKKLLGEAHEIIIATDCDREGENIARSIIQLAGAGNKPTKRLWINSLEVDEIHKGFRNLKEGKNYLSLYKEAQTRQYSDWLVGINASRLYSLLLQQKGLRGVFSVGRVQTPTLQLIYKRQKEIENFKPKPFFELFGDVSINNGEFEAKHKARFNTENEANETLSQYGIQKGRNNGVIKSVEKNFKKTSSPKLHSLSTLQTKANKRWNYSPSEVLKIAQDLYEKKMISYPRTDTHYITDSEFAYLKERILAYQKCLGISHLNVVYSNARQRYVDNSKVQEHYALIPTKQIATLNELSEKEKNIYTEIVSTTLAMFMGDYEYEETKVEVDVKGLMFNKTGKVEKNKGWKVLFKDEKKKKNDETVLPEMQQGDKCSVIVKIKDGMTKPPKAYTEGGLIQVMKYAGKEIEDDEAKEILKQIEGIGTEATRASIIETLKHQKYITVKKNIVQVTSKGETLCQAVDGTLLASPEMTAKWEHFLNKIGKNEGSQSMFLDTIEKFVLSLIENAPKQVKKMESQLEKTVKDTFVGDCVMCGHKGGKVQDKGKFYGCSRYREGCRFTLPKTFLGKKLLETHIKNLLDGKPTDLIKGFKSKKGNRFDAYLRIDYKTGELRLDFPNKK